MWLETDDLVAITREFEEARGIWLQNLGDRQVWLLQGYLITVTQSRPTNATPSVSPKLRSASRFRTLLTYVGLALIIILFSVVFVGTLIFMATHP
jgi:hypothetical protein